MFANGMGRIGRGLRSGVSCLGYYAVGGAFTVQNREFIVNADDGQTYRVVPGSSNLDLLLSTYPGRFTRAAFTGALLSDGRLLSDGGAGSLSANETYTTTRRGDCPAWVANFGATIPNATPVPSPTSAPETSAPAPTAGTTPAAPGTTTTAPGTTTTAPEGTAGATVLPSGEVIPTVGTLGTEDRMAELGAEAPDDAPAMTEAGPSIPLALALAGAALFAVLVTTDRRR